MVGSLKFLFNYFSLFFWGFFTSFVLVRVVVVVLVVVVDMSLLSLNLGWGNPQIDRKVWSDPKEKEKKLHRWKCVIFDDLFCDTTHTHRSDFT